MHVKESIAAGTIAVPVLANPDLDRPARLRPPSLMSLDTFQRAPGLRFGSIG